MFRLSRSGRRCCPHGLGVVMSNDWPRGWYSDEPDQPGAAGQRSQPSFTPGSQGQGSPRPGSQRPTSPRPGSQGPAGASRTAWPAQPPSRSWTGGAGGAGGAGGYGRRGWRRWLRPRRILVILASLVVLVVLAAVAVYFSVNSKLTRINVLVPTSLTSAGTNWLIASVQNATGLPISHFMSIGFGGLVTVVDDVGGVRMCLKAPMKDPKAGLNLKAGCQVLNGAQALGFVRTRAFAEGDLQREQDQRALLKGILSKMTSGGTLANPFAIVPAANGAASAISVDQGTGLTQLISVAFALRNPVTTTVPFGRFAGTSVGSVVEWNTTAAKQFFSDLGHDQALPKNLVTGTSVQGTS